MSRRKRASVDERDRRFARLVRKGKLRESDRKSFYQGWRNAGKVVHGD